MARFDRRRDGRGPGARADLGATGHATAASPTSVAFARDARQATRCSHGPADRQAPPAPPAARRRRGDPPEKAFAGHGRRRRTATPGSWRWRADLVADAADARSARARSARRRLGRPRRAWPRPTHPDSGAQRRRASLAAAAAATAREATARKRLALPDYDPANVLRGEDGLCGGVKDATLERCAGRLVVSAEPTEAGARATLEALGDDDDGATVEVVVEGLVVVSGKGSRIPTVRVRRVNLRARATWSAAAPSTWKSTSAGCTPILH